MTIQEDIDHILDTDVWERKPNLPSYYLAMQIQSAERWGDKKFWFRGAYRTVGKAKKLLARLKEMGR